MHIIGAAAATQPTTARSVEGDDKVYELARPAWRRAADPAWQTIDWQLEGLNWRAFALTLTQLELEFDDHRRALWQYMLPKERPSFTPELIGDMSATLDFVENAWCHRVSGDEPIAFLVLASRLPGIFNLGGDLPRFLHLIESRDGEKLRRYAHACVDGQQRLAVNLSLPLCTMALVQGDALGGGFEAALAHNVIVAERQAKFGLPEILFNLFPGMGAYTFLARRIGPALAERVILSGRVYTATEMHEMGIVDVLAETGEGEQACEQFMTQYKKTMRTRRAVFQAGQIVNPVSRDELFRVADLWVDAALGLDVSDLRKMQHLAKAQDRRWAKLRRLA